MKYAIIGSGKIGTALASIFARKNIQVAIATPVDLRRLHLWRKNSVLVSFRNPFRTLIRQRSSSSLSLFLPTRTLRSSSRTGTAGSSLT